MTDSSLTVKGSVEAHFAEWESSVEGVETGKLDAFYAGFLTATASEDIPRLAALKTSILRYLKSKDLKSK